MKSKDYIKARYILIALWTIMFLFNLITVIWKTPTTTNWILIGITVGIVFEMVFSTRIIKSQDMLIGLQNYFIKRQSKMLDIINNEISKIVTKKKIKTK